MKDSAFPIGSDQKRRLATFSNRQPDGSLKAAPFEMPQRPEFFMGGRGAFSTPRDYMAFLQMLLNGGSLNGKRVLRPATVAQMMTNQIDDLGVQQMRTAQPDFSNSFDQFPGQPHKWGLSFDINTQPGPNGRGAGSISWTGLLNCYFWTDPVKRVPARCSLSCCPSSTTAWSRSTAISNASSTGASTAPDRSVPQTLRLETRHVSQR
jgi:methyl acetate hydrolase